MSSHIEKKMIMLTKHIGTIMMNNNQLSNNLPSLNHFLKLFGFWSKSFTYSL